MRIIVSCEHATAHIPEPYAELFVGAAPLLATHRGYDIGALEVSRQVEDLAEAAFYGGCSRLLIDLNRSLQHPRLFSSFSKMLPRPERERIVTDWYTPFRELVLTALERTIARYGETAHLSLHSFTPLLDGVVRAHDIGILYDPRRHREKELARRLAAAIRWVQATLSIRMNAPYRGTADGHASALRRHFSEAAYLGIELEINQHLLGDERGRTKVGQVLHEAFEKTGLGKPREEPKREAGHTLPNGGETA